MANGWLGAVPGLKFLADKLGKGGPQVEVVPKWQRDLGEQLGGWAKQFLAQYKPGEAYGGRLTTSATPQEQTGLGLLDNFLSAPGTGDLFSAAENQTRDTLAGKYTDAATNPFVQSLIKLSNQNLGDSINQARRSAGARGSYFTKSAIADENLLRERANTGLNAQVGSILNQERQNQVNAVPVAQALDEYKNITLPTTKIGSSQKYGSLQRLIDASNIEAQYQDYQRQRSELASVPGVAQGVYNGGKAPDPAYLQQPNQFSQMLQSIIKLVSAGAPLLAGL